MQTSDTTKRSCGTILLAEDEEHLRELLATILRDAGFAVIETDAGDAGWSENAKIHERIDLLVSDVVLPVMSGFKLFQYLRQSFPDLKVIFMSGYAAEEVAEECPLPTGTVFLQKPFKNSTLIARVHEVLHQTG